MELKGGIAYLNMYGSDVTTNISEENAVYVNGLYKPFNNMCISRKLGVIYNTGGNLVDVPVLIVGYTKKPDGVIITRISTVGKTGYNVSKRIYIKPNDTYYITD